MPQVVVQFHIFFACWNSRISILSLAKEKIVSILNNEMKSELRSWDKKLHQCRNFALHKKGSVTDPANYRFIVIGGIFIKLVLKMVEQRVAKVVEKEKIIRDEAFGGRKGIGTQEALIVINRITCSLYYQNN